MTTGKGEEVNYLRKRLDHLRSCIIEIENRLSDDKTDFINRCQDEDTRAKYVIHIEGAVLNTFRYSMLVAVCTFLEESVRSLCGRAVTDYATRLKASGRGTWLAKHRCLLANHTSVDVVGMKRDLDTMEEFVQVRNCIAHAWGKVDACRNNRQLRDIVSTRSECFYLSADGFLIALDQAVLTALTASRRIVDKLLRDLLGLPKRSM